MKKLTKILPRRLQGRGENASSKNGKGGLAGPAMGSARDHHQLSPRKAIPTKKPTRTGASRIIVASPPTDVANGLHQENGNKDAAAGPGNDHVDGEENGHQQPTPLRHRAAPAPAGSAQLICEHCAAIGFPRLFDWKPGEPRPWVPLAHTLNDDSDCPYCTFFQAMVGHVPGAGVDGIDTPSTLNTSNGSDPETRKVSTTSTFTPYFRIRHAFERLGVSKNHELGRSVLFEVTTRNKSLPRGYIFRAVEQETSIDGYLESAPDDGAAVSETGTQSSQPSTQQQPSNLLRGRTVPAFLDPSLPRCWIDYCKEHHADERCASRPAAAGKIPLKLIDAQQAKVISVAEIDSQEYQYATLSYALGDSDPEPLGEQADLRSNPPALIKDALSLTLSLGYRYLWAGHYCLPARENKLERRRQLDLLGDVFAHSALTIIVAAGDGLADGIPGVSVPRDEDQLSLQNESGLFTTSLLRPDVEIAASRWANNAWTLQEGLLARRRLILTPSQVYFQCAALHCHESVSIPLRLAPSFSFGRILPLDGLVGADIRNLIGTYMTREISRPQERLDAFRGISRAYTTRETDRVDTFMGLPLFDPDSFRNRKVVSQTDRLAIAMSWVWSGRLVSSSHEAYSDLEPCYLDKTAHFPSWTWLSWRIREDQPITQSGHSFRIPLVNDEPAYVVDGLCAPPRTEISVGFADGLLVSWEIDGAAISRRAEPITFLRIKTFSFALKVAKKDDDWQITEPAEMFDQTMRDIILLLVRSSQFPAGADPRTAVCIPDGEFAVTAMLLTGRHWRTSEPSSNTRPTAKPAEHAATALLCAPREWKSEGPLVRLGVASFTYTGFTITEARDGDDDSGQATLHGVSTVSGDKKSLTTELRELDIY